VQRSIASEKRRRPHADAAIDRRQSGTATKRRYRIAATLGARLSRLQIWRHRMAGIESMPSAIGGTGPLAMPLRPDCSCP
jgi:hypothetical protein